MNIDAALDPELRKRDSASNRMEDAPTCCVFAHQRARAVRRAQKHPEN